MPETLTPDAKAYLDQAAHVMAEIEAAREREKILMVERDVNLRRAYDDGKGARIPTIARETGLSASMVRYIVLPRA